MRTILRRILFLGEHVQGRKPTSEVLLKNPLNSYQIYCALWIGFTLKMAMISFVFDMSKQSYGSMGLRYDGIVLYFRVFTSLYIFFFLKGGVLYSPFFQLSLAS